MDWRDKRGQTALLHAVRESAADRVYVLLHALASPEVCDDAYITPLHASAETGHGPITELLLAYGGRTTLHKERFDGRVPASCAKGEAKQVLLGEDPSKAGDSGKIRFG